MKIKEGALVKAWNNDVSDYAVGTYEQYNKGGHWPHSVNLTFVLEPFKNAIEIPEELAKALEDLGDE